MKKYFLVILIMFSTMPVLSFAQAPVELDYNRLVKCDGVVVKDGTEPKRDNECDFNDLLVTVKSLINWLFVITVPIATVLFAYAGLLYLTGTPGNIGTAKKIFSSVAYGFIIMLIAWFGVITVVNWFIDEKSRGVINTFVNTK